MVSSTVSGAASSFFIAMTMAMVRATFEFGEDARQVAMFYSFFCCDRRCVDEGTIAYVLEADSVGSADGIGRDARRF